MYEALSLYALAATNARPFLLEADRQARLAARLRPETWRGDWLAECDAILDAALDTAYAVEEHSLRAELV